MSAWRSTTRVSRRAAGPIGCFIRSPRATTPKSHAPSRGRTAPRSKTRGRRWRRAPGALTAEAVVYLRHGKPDERAFCISDLLHGITVVRDPPCSNFSDEESWVYFTPAGALSIRFGSGEYFAPISAEQRRSASILLRTDRTTLPAPLLPHASSGTFAGAVGLTDVYYKAAGDSTSVALWGSEGAQRIAGRGLLHLTVPPGNYDLGLDVDSAGLLGRIRRTVEVPFFPFAELSLS